MLPQDIEEFNSLLAEGDREICSALAAEIVRGLPEAEGKVWHAHPVWFINGNPIVGYTKLKDRVRLMFWSGQSFDEPGLSAEGTFKMGAAHYTEAAQIDREIVQIWLAKSREIQWDYKNIRKRKGTLVMLEKTS